MTVTGHGPLVGGRRLRAELKRLRDRAHLTQDVVAEEMDWSLSKLIRIEAGSVNISTNDLKALLELYGVRDTDEVEAMLELQRAARQKMWWNEYRETMGKYMAHFVASEAEASVFKTYQLLAFPGLLQTEDYARTMISYMTFGSPTEAEIERSVQLRMARQKQFFGRPEPARLHAVLDESLFRRAVGGPVVLREQIAYVLDMIDQRSELTVQVLPHSVGILPGMATSFYVMEFNEAEELPAVFVEGINTHVMENLADSRVVSSYQAAFNRLGQRAENPADSKALIKKLMGEVS
jgi:transcriptional regulator with XRE-family HTH domain